MRLDKMMRAMLALWLLLGWAGSALAGGLEPLRIETENRVIDFRVEYAGTQEEQARGLMFRDHLAPRTGMIFDFHSPKRAAFWMRNTLISLDMLFLDQDGVIHFIAPRTTPLSEATISPAGHSLGVLEINGGEAQILGIKIGDRVIHRMFD